MPHLRLPNRIAQRGRTPRWPFEVDEESTLAEGLVLALPVFYGPGFGIPGGKNNPRLRHERMTINASAAYARGAMGRWSLTGNIDGLLVQGASKTTLLHGRTAFTVLIRCNWNSMGTSLAALCSAWGSGVRSILFRRSANDLQFFTYTSAQAGGAVGTPSVSATSDMQTFVARYDGATMDAAVDGVFLGTTYSQSGGVGEGAGVDLQFGGDSNSTSGRELNSPVYETLVWHRALSDDEVRRVSNPATCWEHYREIGRRTYFIPAAVGGPATWPHSPLGGPFAGALGGPI